jgi:antitoxin MazE
MRTNLIRIGNSRGIRIPKPLIEQAGLAETVSLTAEKGRLVIRAERKLRHGWEDAFAAGEKEPPILDPVSNRFDREEWSW